MPTTKRDIQALHYLAQRLRDETHGAGKWHDNGLIAVLAKLEGRNLADTIERVTRHAADKDARTPAAIERPFVPPPSQSERGHRYPPKAADECRTHPGQGQWSDSCAICLGPKPVDEEPGDRATRPQQTPPTDRSDLLAAARQAIADAKAAHRPEETR